MSGSRDGSLSLTDFTTQFSSLVLSEDKTALQNYFQENVPKLQSTIKSGSQIAVFLNILPIEHWKNFISQLDQAWFKALFSDGTQLGILLEKIVSYKKANQFGMNPIFKFINVELVDDALIRWQQFLACLDPDWQEKLVDNPVELNAILNQLDRNGDLKNTKKVELFLNNFLNQEKINKLDTLLSVLNPALPEAKCLNATVSLEFVQIFSPRKVYKLLLRDKKFDEVLSIIDKHSDKSYYNALLFAITNAWHYEREKNPAEYTTEYEAIRGYTRQFKLELAAYLMRSIADQKLIIATSGLTEGQLGRIFKRYTESLTHTNKLHS